MRKKLSAFVLVGALVMVTPALTILPVGAAAKQTVSISLGAASVKTGQTTHIKGKVAPAASGKAIRLQRFYGKAWHGFKAQKLTAKSTYDFGVKLTTAGTYKFRVAAPSAFSKAVTLKVAAPRNPNPPPPHGPISPR